MVWVTKGAGSVGLVVGLRCAVGGSGEGVRGSVEAASVLCARWHTGDATLVDNDLWCDVQCTVLHRLGHGVCCARFVGNKISDAGAAAIGAGLVHVPSLTALGYVGLWRDGEMCALYWWCVLGAALVEECGHGDVCGWVHGGMRVCV